MIESLAKNYVLYACERYVYGVKSLEDRTMDLIDISSEALPVLEGYSFIKRELESGSLVQLSNEGGFIQIYVGTKAYEGAYNENDALDVIASAKGECLFETLNAINTELSVARERITVRQRLHREYNADRFTF